MRYSRLLAFTASVLLLALSLSGAALAVPSEKNNFELYFGPSPDRTKTIDNFFIEYVDSTKKTLDGCFFEFRLDSIVDAFIRAKKRGVVVRLVTDTDTYDSEFVKKLRKAGIEVKSDNNRSALMHNKFAISDSSKVWTGSYNLTDTCSFNNNNNALSIYSKELSEIYQREFDEMFLEDKFGATSPSTLDTQKAELTILGKKTPVEVYFAPEDSPNAHIQELLAGAKKEIYFMHFAFTANDISDTLIEKSKAGVNVAGIFDSKLYRSTGPYSEFYKLTNEDIKIILADNPDGKFHHKVFIVDPSTDDGFVITGSENSSSNGDGTNDENVMVIHNDKVAKAYFAEFRRLFGTFSNAYATCVNLYVKPEQKIPDVNLVFNSNGKPVDKIEISYPARWALTGEEQVNVFTLDKKPFPKGTLIFNKKGFSAVNLGLKAFGKGSFIVFNFKKLTAPKIKGGYNLYVKCSNREGEKPMPLKYQPGIHVADQIVIDDSAAAFDALIQKMYLSYSELMNMQDNSASDEVFEKLYKNWQNNYFELKEVILADANAQRYDRIDKFLEMYSKLTADQRSKIPGLVKELKAILKKHTADGDEEAKSRLKQL